ILNKCNISGGCTASVQVNVDRWNASNFGASQGYSVNKICDQQGDCNIGTVECRIPYNGSACKVATSSKIAEWTSRGYEIYLNLGVTTSTSNTKFFDRDAQTCASNQAGCSQFIRVGDGHQSGLVTTTTDGYKLAITNQDYDPSTIVANDIAYLKKAPWYYNCYSDSANGSWPATQGELDDVLIKRNSECSNYAGVCIPSEVGCKLYEPKNGDPEVPGVVKPIDSCPSECDGYQVYRQSQTAFSSPRYTQFIANNKAKYCSASYAGCDEFTNLDELVAGGESKEYYTNLRICQKNAPIGPSDAKTYYTWEGAETTGYQLVTFKLKQSNSTGVESGSPCTKMQYNGASDKDAQCGDASNITDELIQTAVDLAPITNHNLVSYLAYISSTTDATQIPTGAVSQSVADKLHEYGICLKLETHGYNANGVDIAPNADCREFYDSNGDVYYRLLSKVIYVTDDCHPYRRTLTQDPSLTTQCAELNNENVSVTQCDCVSNNGFWSDEKECVYMAVPKMGQSCSASFVGCREYTGNLSNDINFLVNDNFDNSYSNWSGSNSNLSIVSTAVGGFSWFTKATTSKQVYVKRNHTYTLSFWAKGYPGGDNDHASSAGFDLESIKFSSASEQSDYFAKSQLQNISLNVPKVHIGNEWQRYDLGPVFVTFADDGWQDLTINPGATNSIGNDLYIDNITLKEVKGNVYVIENSWFTPNSCDNKLDDPTGTACANGRCNPGEMLGCQAYNNKTDNVDPIYLRSFTSLCRAEAVGCEAMIDTHNSNATSSESFGGTVATADSVSVVKDNLAFIVNDKKFSCLAENKGCSAYGQPVINNRNEVMGYSTVYIKNDPQTYSRSLCRAENLWCGEYATNNTYNYFKDPRQQVCEFKSLTTSSTPAWYRMGEDGLCDTSPYQTIGLGVVSEKLQPDQNMKWAGVCPSSQSSCTEFIDPLTNNYASLLYNGDFSQNLGDINRPDGWEINSIGFNYKKEVTHSFVTGIVSQDVNLIDDRLYSLSMLADGQVAIDVKCSEGSMRSPDGSMVISSDGSSASLNYNLIASSSVSGRLYARDTKNCTLLVGASGSVTDVKLTESGVYYNLSDQMTDSRASCQGMVDYRKGCVLLNDRGAVNYADNPSTRDRSYLIYDADYIENKNVGTSQAIAVNKANDDSSGLKSNVSANAVIKVQPDRQCASWLYCNTFEKGNVNDPNPVLGSSDQCLGLALCSALDGMGNCSLFVNNQNKISVYDKGLDINKTGYSMLGKQIPNASGKSSSTVLGYYPYHLMSQVGEDANIANSDFEYIYNADQPKPIGWKPGVDTAWTIDKFSVATSKTDRKEGIGYLKVNADGTVRSNPISVDGDNAYSFSAWINTSYLYPSPQAKVLISVNGRVIDTVSAGLPWQRISKPLPPEVYQNGGALYVSVQNCFATVGSGQNTKCMTIQQASTTVTTGCLDSNLDGQCDVSGYSLFDLISLKPILEAGKDVNNSNIYISRSCRLYPEGDSQACNYVKNGDMYNGWQGFCMVSDPNNPQICLQWWPVDKIKGDGEPYYFSKSFPLYYCAALEGDMHLVEHREVVLFNYTSKTIKSAWNSAAWYKWLGPPGLIYAGVNTVF
ncbi:MAG: hypothetical protein WCL61_02095, partial [bacterium]